MELTTTVKDFVREIRTRHIAPETRIRVIIDDSMMKSASLLFESPRLPVISSKEQIRLLNLLPSEYMPENSEEIIRIIEHSHKNTEPLKL